MRDNAGDLRDVPHDTSPIMYSVCHMSDSDTLLVGLYEDKKWLVALSRKRRRVARGAPRAD